MPDGFQTIKGGDGGPEREGLVAQGWGQTMA